MAAAMVAILVGACSQAAPSGTPGGTAATQPPPSAAATAVPSTLQPTPTVPPVQSGGMTLLGSVPGSNGDMAFWGDLAIVTTFEDWERESVDDGFLVVDIADAAKPAVLGSFRCFGAFQDVSTWDGLAILSQDRVRPNDSCAGDATSGTSFAGLRIVSIADPSAPVLLASVPTGVDTVDPTQVRGTHTHTIVPDLARNRLLVYAGIYYYPDTHPHASIVEVPLQDPAAARVIGTFENGTNRPCHDITVFVPGKIAACAAYEAGVILFDISDPVRPTVVSRFSVPQMNTNGESHHSTVFASDGRTLVVNAESFDRPCVGGTTATFSALWFYDISDPAKPLQRGSFRSVRSGSHGCYPHQSNVVPTAERDLLVTGWYGGGVNVVDFSDPAAPRELAFFVSNEGGGRHSMTAYAYWYNGRVYASNYAPRGYEIFEVDAGLLPGAPALPYLNPQTQVAPPAS